MAGGDDQLRIYVEQLAQALQHNMPPPPIPADMPPGAVSEIDMLLAGLGMAGNSGDPKDMANGQAGFAQRGDKTGEAMAKFPANDQDASKELEQLMGTATQMPQQLMQAFGGIFSPFTQGMSQAMQQVSQIGSQLASSMGKAGQGAGLGASLPADALGRRTRRGRCGSGCRRGRRRRWCRAGRCHRPGRKPWAATDSVSRNLPGRVATGPGTPECTRSGRGIAGDDGRRNADDAAWRCGRCRRGRQRQQGRDQAGRTTVGEERCSRAGPHHHAADRAGGGEAHCGQTDSQQAHGGSRGQARRRRERHRPQPLTRRIQPACRSIALCHSSNPA